MKTKEQRLNNIIGQIEGIKKLIKKDAECVAVLTQLKAVKAAIGSVMDGVVEDQLNNCMKSLNSKDKKLFTKMRSYVKAN